MLIFKLFPLISFHLKTFNILVSRKNGKLGVTRFFVRKVNSFTERNNPFTYIFCIFFLEAAFLKCDNMLFIAYQAYTKRHPNVR